MTPFPTVPSDSTYFRATLTLQVSCQELLSQFLHLQVEGLVPKQIHLVLVQATIKYFEQFQLSQLERLLENVEEDIGD